MDVTFVSDFRVVGDHAAGDLIVQLPGLDDLGLAIAMKHRDPVVTIGENGCEIKMSSALYESWDQVEDDLTDMTTDIMGLIKRGQKLRATMPARSQFTKTY